MPVGAVSFGMGTDYSEQWTVNSGRARLVFLACCGIRGAKMRFAVVVFPGTWSDHDTHHALTAVLGQEADLVWHRERDLSRYDVVVLPGGFSYGDYLRTGALARFSPGMEAVAAHAEAGKPVIGICNGFQVLCEAHLLPGAPSRQ